MTFEAMGRAMAHETPLRIKMAAPRPALVPASQREVMMSDLLTVEQVAEYLQMSTKWIYTQAKAGALPAIKVGRLWRFRQADIDAWLEKR